MTFNFWQGLSSIVSSLGRGFRISWGRSSPPIERSDSDSGIVVTHEKALTLSVAWACVALAARTVATFPCFTYRRVSATRKQLATDHELYTILHDRPNATMTAVDFWTMLIASERMWGNGYAAVRRLGTRVVALDPWLPQYVVPYISRDTGKLRYRYDPGPAEEREDLPYEDVYHLKGLTLDGLVGLSPLEAARNSFGRALAAEQTAGNLFKRGLMPSTLFKFPHVLSPKRRRLFRKALLKYQGAANAGEPFLLEKGLEMSALSWKPADAELLASRGWNVEDICRWYGTPPPLVGHTDKASSWASSLEGLNRGYLTYTLNPILIGAEKAAQRSLIRPEERNDIYIKFSVEGLLRADAEKRAQLYAQLAQNGIMTRNEIRELEDLEPMPGGDELTAQSNLVPLGALGDAATTAQSAAANAVRAWLGLVKTDKEYIP